MSVTVITATMPGRGSLLKVSMASVSIQTHKPTEHLIAVDYVQTGGARVYNLLASSVKTPWLAVLNDDDVLYARHLELLMEQTADADVVYSWCDVSGPDPWTAYNRPFDPEMLRRNSIVSHNALIRTEFLAEIGGWDERPGWDYHLWVKALDHGARFVCVPAITWLYRLDAEWKHESRPWLG